MRKNIEKKIAILMIFLNLITKCFSAGNCEDKNIEFSSKYEDLINLYDSKNEEITLEDIKDSLSEEVKELINFASDAKLKEIEEKILNFHSEVYSSELSDEKKEDLNTIFILQTMINNNTFGNEEIKENNDRILKTRSIIEQRFNKFRDIERAKYDQNEYASMKKSSEEFGSSGKNTSDCSPDSVIFLNQDYKFSNPLINFEGNPLISIPDFFQPRKADIEYMEKSPVISVTDPVLGNFEFPIGESFYFLNDKKQKLETNSIVTNDTPYISIFSICGICNFHIIEINSASGNGFMII